MRKKTLEDKYFVRSNKRLSEEQFKNKNLNIENIKLEMDDNLHFHYFVPFTRDDFLILPQEDKNVVKKSENLAIAINELRSNFIYTSSTDYMKKFLDSLKSTIPFIEKGMMKNPISVIANESPDIYHFCLQAIKPEISPYRQLYHDIITPDEQIKLVKDQDLISVFRESQQAVKNNEIIIKELENQDESDILKNIEHRGIMVRLTDNIKKIENFYHDRHPNPIDKGNRFYNLLSNNTTETIARKFDKVLKSNRVNNLTKDQKLSLTSHLTEDNLYHNVPMHLLCKIGAVMTRMEERENSAKSCSGKLKLTISDLLNKFINLCKMIVGSAIIDRDVITAIAELNLACKNNPIRDIDMMNQSEKEQSEPSKFVDKIKQSINKSGGMKID